MSYIVNTGQTVETAIHLHGSTTGTDFTWNLTSEYDNTVIDVIGIYNDNADPQHAYLAFYSDKPFSVSGYGGRGALRYEEDGKTAYGWTVLCETQEIRNVEFFVDGIGVDLKTIFLSLVHPHDVQTQEIPVHWTYAGKTYTASFNISVTKLENTT